MTLQWKVIYYIEKTGGNPVSEFLDTLSPQQQAKILRILLYLQEYGLQSIIPHTKKLSGTSFWEIRILGKDNIRILYVVPLVKTVLLLHGFTKKKQKTPHKELETTKIRFQDWKNRLDK